MSPARRKHCCRLPFPSHALTLFLATYSRYGMALTTNAKVQEVVREKTKRHTNRPTTELAHLDLARVTAC
jgi:hypothetical protein